MITHSEPRSPAESFRLEPSFGAGDVEIAVSTFPEAFYISIAEVGHSEQTHTKTPWGQLIRTTTTAHTHYWKRYRASVEFLKGLRLSRFSWRA